MSLIKDTSIRIKILLPSVLFIILPVITILILSQFLLQKNASDQIDKIVNDKMQSFEKAIRDLSARDLKTAYLSSTFPAVQEAYRMFNQDSAGSTQSSKYLEKYFDEVIKHLHRQFSEDLKIHFHLPNVTSFYRSWTRQKGDDLSFTRQPVLFVSKSHQPISGLDISREGIIICSVSPVFSIETKRYQGSVELISSVSDVLNLVKTRDDEEFGLFLHSRIIDRFYDVLATKPDSSLRLGNFYRMNVSTEKFIMPMKHANVLDDVYNKINNVISFKTGNYYYVAFKLFNFNQEPLGVGIYQLNIESFNKEFSYFRILNFIIAIFYILIGIITMYFISRLIVNPVNKVNEIIFQLQKGHLPSTLRLISNDEVGKMVHSINQLVNSMKRKSLFAVDIGKGNYITDFKPDSDDDILGNALLGTRESLKKARIEQLKRVRDDEQLNWSTKGRSMFIDILRKSTNNISELADDLIRGLVTYMLANQGGLFFLNDEDPSKPYLELISTFAYNQKRFIDRKIPVGDGLVGMCALEKYTIYRTDIPDEYIQITSGLGSANPRCILIVPLKLDNKVLGVIEIASFQDYEPYHIKFVEDISENIAAAISNVKVNERTAALLVQSREYTDKLEKAEASVKEQYDLVKEEYNRAKDKFNKSFSATNAIDRGILRAEITKDGTLIDGNELFFATLKFLPIEIKGKKLLKYMDTIKEERFDILLNRLTKGGDYYFEHIRFITRSSKNWIFSFFAPLKDDDGVIKSILFLGIDIDNQKRHELSTQAMVESFNKSLIIKELKPDGTVRSYNDVFMKFTGFTKIELQRGNIFDGLSYDEEIEMRQIWNRIIEGTPIQRFEQIRKKDGSLAFVNGIYAPVMNYENIIEKVIFMGIDITEQ